MVTTKTSSGRGRPRSFDTEEALATAQRLFHARGYDAVGVAELTDAIGISPPSFYAAFGSKAGLFARILDRYTCTEGVPLADLLQPGRPVAEALAAVVEEAARRYAAKPDARGCLAIEGTRSNDHAAQEAARELTSAARTCIHQFVRATNPKSADRLADYVVTIMSGLSTMAREGFHVDRLVSVAALASMALPYELCTTG